jgi:hypothetical protein
MTFPFSVYFMHHVQESTISVERYASYLHWRHDICSTCIENKFIKFYIKQLRVAPGLTPILPLLVINIFATL